VGGYDRALIAEMLGELVYDDGYGFKSRSCYTVEAIKEQIDALGAAENAEASRIQTANRAATPAGGGDALDENGLLPCPFCYGGASLETDDGATAIHCAVCGTGQRWHSERADAIAAWNSRRLASAPAIVGDETLRVLAALGHEPKVSDNCTAHVVQPPSEDRPPGPANSPVWCVLKAGHEGPHRCSYGTRSFPFRSSDTVEFRETPTLCATCRTRWPCQEAQKALAAAPAQEPSNQGSAG
jgi:hypothetical protein